MGLPYIVRYDALFPGLAPNPLTLGYIGHGPSCTVESITGTLTQLRNGNMIAP